MSFFDKINQPENATDSLPEVIRRKVLENGSEIKSAEELAELVRRIRTAETGKIF